MDHVAQDKHVHFSTVTASKIVHKKGLLLFDGAHLALGLAAIDNNVPLSCVVLALEKAFHCQFHAKEWHEVVPEGCLTRPHLATIEREKDLILKLRPRRSSVHQQQSAVQGVELSLAVALLCPPSPPETYYDTVVVVTAAGDLDDVLERCTIPTVHVCTLQKYASPYLHPWMRSGVSLDDILVLASQLFVSHGVPASVISPPTEKGGVFDLGGPLLLTDETTDDGQASSQQMLKSAAQETNTSGVKTTTTRRRRRSNKLRLKCFAGIFCTKLGDEEHLRRTSHPCLAGVHCPIIGLLQDHQQDDDSGEEKWIHMERFLHPCPEGRACVDESMEHVAWFEHIGRGVMPLCTRKSCRGNERGSHITPHRHICPHGKNCTFLGHSVADKRVIRHTSTFLHPCPWGERCVAARSPLWNHEHMQSFTHNTTTGSSTSHHLLLGHRESKDDAGSALMPSYETEDLSSFIKTRCFDTTAAFDHKDVVGFFQGINSSYYDPPQAKQQYFILGEHVDNKMNNHDTSRMMERNDPFAASHKQPPSDDYHQHVFNHIEPLLHPAIDSSLMSFPFTKQP